MFNFPHMGTKIAPFFNEAMDGALFFDRDAIYLDRRWHSKAGEDVLAVFSCQEEGQQECKI